jgi:hypothetical protein
MPEQPISAFAYSLQRRRTSPSRPRRLCKVAALLLAISAMAVPAKAQPPATTLAVLPIKLLDTSAEPKDQTDEHRLRLQSMAVELRSDLGSLGRYHTVPVLAEDVQRTCIEETTDCLLSMARSQGAELVFVGVVHKSSTLIMQMWARIVDAQTGGVLFSRELNFRGDNDEAWHRAEAFLIDQIREAAPQVQR